MVSGGTAAAPVPVTPSPIAARTGGTDVAGPGAGPGAGPDTTLPPLYSQNQAYQTGIPGITIGGAASPLAPPGTTPASLAAPATTAPGATSPGTTPAAQTAPPAASGSGNPNLPPIPQLPPPPSRAIPLEPLIQSGPLAGLTANQAREAQSAGIGGVHDRPSLPSA